MKKIIAGILCGCMVAVSGIGALAKNFKDVPKTHWAYSYVSEMSEKKVVNGYTDGTFKPEANVTRAEFAKMLAVTAGFEECDGSIKNYTDISNDAWYVKYVDAVDEYLTGSEPLANGKSFYLPDEPALRCEVAVAIAKALNIKADSMTVRGYKAQFVDLDFSDEELVYICALLRDGIMNGMDATHFDGNGKLTRAQAATVLSRAFKEKKKVVKTPEYVTRKLADASLLEARFATAANENIYYVDDKDNYVYVIDAKTGKKERYFDCNELIYEEGINEYSEYEGRQVFFDEKNKKLLLAGQYTLVTGSGKATELDLENTYIYDITDQEAELYCVPKWTYKDRYCPIVAVLDKEHMLIGGPIRSGMHDGTFEVDIDSGTTTDISVYGEHTLEYEGELYDLWWGNLEQYNFNKDARDKMFSHPDSIAIGMKDDCYYYYYEGEDRGVVSKVSVETGKTKLLDIIFNDRYQENMDTRLLVIDDDTMIFYDTAGCAFYRVALEYDEPVKKQEYVTRKLADANIKEARLTTVKDDYLYYADIEDNCVYKIDLETGKKTEYFDANNLVYEEDEYEYSDFEVAQVFYDDINDKLLLLGQYTRRVGNGSVDTILDDTYIYDITNRKADFYCAPYSHFDERTGKKVASYKEIADVLDNESLLLTKWSYLYELDKESEKYFNLDQNLNFSGMKYATLYNDCIYGLRYGDLSKYDLDSGDIETICDRDNGYNMTGAKDEYFYFYGYVSGSQDKVVTKVSVKTGKTTLMDIKISNRYTQNVDEWMLVLDDDTIIFYDDEKNTFYKVSLEYVEVEE